MAADLQPAALAYGVMDDALVPPQLAPLAVDDRAFLARFGPELAHDAGVIAVGHEADVLAVGLGGDRTAPKLVAPDAAHIAALGRRAQRESAG